MQKLNVDVAIIGAGSAGLSARREVERRGRSWVMIDRGPLGTTCARVGCMPSKLLIAAADRAHEVATAEPFGLRVGGLTVDGPAVMERVRRERDRFVGFVIEGIESLPAENRSLGTATFTGPHTLTVDDHTEVTFATCIIATGSHPWVPPGFDEVRDRVQFNDDVFEWPDIPASTAVVGTGIIALELGQALGRLGSEVAFFNPFDELGPVSDPAIRASTREVLGAELDLHLGVADIQYGPDAESDTGVVVSWTADGERHERRFERLLVAAGRRPNLSSLSPEAAGVPVDERGRPNFDPRTMQMGDTHFFIAGDVNSDRPLLHEAADEGRIAGANAALYPNEVLAHQRRTPLGIAFTDPQIAVVGERFAEHDPDAIVVGEVSYHNQGRARVMGQNKGLVRVYVCRKRGCFLGAEMFGPRVEHTAHLLAWAKQANLTVEEMIQMPFYHPVVEEGIRTALRNAARELRLAPKPCATGLDCGPGV